MKTCHNSWSPRRNLITGHPEYETAKTGSWTRHGFGILLLLKKTFHFNSSAQFIYITNSEKGMKRLQVGNLKIILVYNYFSRHPNQKYETSKEPAQNSFVRRLRVYCPDM
jgi:hypothetical protein